MVVIITAAAEPLFIRILYRVKKIPIICERESSWLTISKGQWSVSQLCLPVIRHHNPHLMEAPCDHILATLFAELLQGSIQHPLLGYLHVQL